LIPERKYGHFVLAEDHNNVISALELAKTQAEQVALPLLNTGVDQWTHRWGDARNLKVHNKSANFDVGFSLLWQANVANFSPELAIDIDNDGADEIIARGMEVVGSSNIRVRCYDHDGSIKWTTTLPYYTTVYWPYVRTISSHNRRIFAHLNDAYGCTRHYSDPVVCYLDSDGGVLWSRRPVDVDEGRASHPGNCVLVKSDGTILNIRNNWRDGGDGGFIFAYNELDGSLAWGPYKCGYCDYSNSIIACGDLNDDGKSELAIPWCQSMLATGYMTWMDEDGNLIGTAPYSSERDEAWDACLCPPKRKPTIMYTLIQDGAYVLCYDENFSEVWRTSIGLRIGAFSDFNSDSENEVIIGGTGTIACIRIHDGALIWQKPAPNNRTTVGADFDDDGVMEPCYNDGTKLVFLDGKTGDRKFTLNFGESVPLPILGDVEGNGRLCLIMKVGNTLKVYKSP